MTEEQATYTVIQSAKPARAYMITRGEIQVEIVVSETYQDPKRGLIAKVYCADDGLKRTFEIQADRIHVESL
jgi:hypothetical protein